MKTQLVINRLLLAFLVVGFAMLASCTGRPGSKDIKGDKELVIPDFPSAEDQFKFAKMHQNSQLIAPELERRQLQMAKIGQYFQRVITNFPNDKDYVPLTYLELGDCAAQSDAFELALDYYKKALASTQEEFIVARSQYSIGRIYDTQGRFEEAKIIYKGIMDQFGKSESARVRDVIKRSSQLYMKVHEKK